ncbi:MAG: hypothetical protein HY426_01090 [Candidatus Levybacteria bacterium]|nr:hypothetical protein [Candidatus Levybacteria bacterium]
MKKQRKFSDKLILPTKKSREKSKEKSSHASLFLIAFAILSAIVFGINLKSSKSQKITTSSKIEISPSPTPARLDQGETVINNDSYWKISKRHCGSGKYYLSIREQNDAKPLYKGDFVSVNCSL